MKIVSVVGARPNFMKAAPIIGAVSRHNRSLLASTNGSSTSEMIEHILVHTGQHYDELMSDSFFSDLNLAPPDIHLGAAAGSPAFQTAEIMRKFEAVISEKRPDVVIVVGDVTSTLACALVTAKASFDWSGSRPLLAHVEAGLRSFDRTMPEEINRVVTDHVADLLFVTEPSGVRNLRSEGISPEKIHFVGNTMIDSLLACKQRAAACSILEELGLRRSSENDGGHDAVDRYALLTLHRPSNVDDRDSFLRILSGLEELAKDRPIIFPVHPRTQKRIEDFGLYGYAELRDGLLRGSGQESVYSGCGIVLTQPMGYLDFLCLMMHASVVITDSGGIQEETTCLGIPCVTVRENTERPVTVDLGTNVLAGTNADGIKRAIRRQTEKRITGSVPEKWDGRAAIRIVEIVLRSRGQEASRAAAAVYRHGARQLTPMGTFD
jgi:UDP-N-acetylglucosamine 2-epimerase (non-hydrolysing)